jgi:hypothetical protein
MEACAHMDMGEEGVHIVLAQSCRAAAAVQDAWRQRGWETERRE